MKDKNWFFHALNVMHKTVHFFSQASSVWSRQYSDGINQRRNFCSIGFAARKQNKSTLKINLSLTSNLKFYSLTAADNAICFNMNRHTIKSVYATSISDLFELDFWNIFFMVNHSVFIRCIYVVVKTSTPWKIYNVKYHIMMYSFIHSYE